MEEAGAGESLLADDTVEDPAVKAEEKPAKSQPLASASGLCGPLPSLSRGFLPGLPMIFRFTGDICH